MNTISRVLCLVLCTFSLTSSQRSSYFYPQTASTGRVRRSATIDTVYQWNLLTFGFPTERDRQQAVSNGNLVPENATPIDVQPDFSNRNYTRVFITIPRFATGIPYTLATVTTNGLLKPYPQYNWHSSHGADCDGITSAFRVAITPCNQMWVIDSGMIGSTQRCPPQLLLFDLKTDRLVHRYRFTENVYLPRGSLFVTPAIKVDDPPPSGNCQRTTVYIADVNFHGLVVYDKSQNAAWRVEHRFMYPDPDYGKHTIAGESFLLMDGIFGLSVKPPNLYFHSLASVSEYSVPLNVLAQRAAYEQNIESYPDSFQKLGERNSQCAAEALDSRGNIYCVTFDPISLKQWNVANPYSAAYLRDLSTDRNLLQFISGMKVNKNQGGQEELWMLSCRYQKVAAGTLKSTETNFRVMKRSLDDVQDITLNNGLIFN